MIFIGRMQVNNSMGFYRPLDQEAILKLKQMANTTNGMCEYIQYQMLDYLNIPLVDIDPET